MNLSLFNNNGFTLAQTSQRKSAIRFSIWIFMATVTMLFAAFTSALIVRQGQGNWDLFRFPAIFNFSTIFIVFSSVTMQWAYLSFQKQKTKEVWMAAGITLFAGLVFAFSQISGWNTLYDSGIKLSGNASHSFLFLISGAHLLHLIGGVVLLIFFIVRFSVTPSFSDKITIYSCTVIWHFLTALWVYLFLFLKYYCAA
ncbi:MAG: hypothetical protein A3H98_06555 [Bacteroidetes bacterium RIFCSPLOWO2_02_FULL_36_8]|nr:MAG: hypothetical protein A3H98_06555 [Bacteroidetes bacterium RIFCSPLOWO2_02_FULL_36_8]OFY71125.1 MAG: hypothetical protein A3G23_15065 [Bacteroidetes bacterium RIFCSPLOWO2_12_FULL_37_12]